MKGSAPKYQPPAERFQALVMIGTSVIERLIEQNNYGVCRHLHALLLCTILFAGCSMTLPPSASLNPPSNRLGTVAANAWLNKVEISDPEMDDLEAKAQIENTLTNNLLRYLREGQYYRKVELLLPGDPQVDDHVLHFQFDRYRHKRYSKLQSCPIINLFFLWPCPWVTLESSDLSATLRITRPYGHVAMEAKSEIREEHSVDPSSVEDVLPTGMKARTQVIEDLLQKTLSSLNPSR